MRGVGSPPESDVRERPAHLLVYGTPGWGNTYMLAALAVLLMTERLRGQSKLRVAFIPDCQKLVKSPLKTMQGALVAAFADDKKVCDRLAQATTLDALIAFCDAQPEGTLLFLLDNYNTLPLVPRDNVSAERNAAVSFLEDCSEDHFVVSVTSINDNNKEDILNKGLGVARMSFYGGLTATEQQCWLKHFEARLPAEEKSPADGEEAI